MLPEVGSSLAPRSGSIASVADWLVREGRLLPDAPALIDGLCTQLSAVGLDLLRMNVQVRTLHPEVEVMLFVWRPGEATVELSTQARVIDRATQAFGTGIVEQVALGHGAFESQTFRESPFFAVHQGAPRVRCPIDAAATEHAYPIVADLRRLGGTDYVAFPMRFHSGATSAVSWSTRAPGGFRDEDLDALESLLPSLIVCLEIHAARHATRTLLTTYVGREAGERVLAGKVQRGDVERVDAAIWFSDMRGFTQLSASLDSAELIRWLNEYFGAIAAPIGAGGGEILKFIGDAVLAVFPIRASRSAADVCACALEAARQANAELDHLNVRRLARGLPALEHGIGLHVGEVQYGNIGAERRLDFTVIGQAVNLASRVEGLCGKLGRRTLATSAVAALADEALEPLGTFELKGISEPQRIYGFVT